LSGENVGGKSFDENKLPGEKVSGEFPSLRSVNCAYRRKLAGFANSFGSSSLNSFLTLDREEEVWYNIYMDREKELQDQLNKIQSELHYIRLEKLIENRKLYAGKYFRRYIDDGKNRYHYVYVKEIVGGNLYGWSFTLGDQFTHEYSIMPDESEILDYVADEVFYSPDSKEYENITKESFWLHFEDIADCVIGKLKEK
jgi:hypothetical protein